MICVVQHKTKTCIICTGVVGYGYAPIIVNPHLPQVVQWLEIIFVVICQCNLSQELGHMSKNFHYFWNPYT